VSALKVAMKNDYQLTQKCGMILAAFMPTTQPGGFVLRKRSTHLEMFNRGYFNSGLLINLNESNIFKIINSFSYA
jgi:hypothetical protein